MAVQLSPERLGPILYYRGAERRGVRLAALVVRPVSETPPELYVGGKAHQPTPLADLGRSQVWRFDFSMSADDESYAFDGTKYPVVSELSGDLRLAFVSCNGEEHNDLARNEEERNAMWAALADDHKEKPYALLIQGGDQIYADEVTHGHPLCDEWPDRVPKPDNLAELNQLETHLKTGFAERYLRTLEGAAPAWVMARVPSVAMWDDHDICDGWGSLYRNRTYTEVGQAIFRCAREMYLLFQHAATEADIPDLFSDPTGTSLSWERQLPGVNILAPDLRSERGRKQVLGAHGWSAVEAMEPSSKRTFVVSSVPLLGPRLSLVERFMLMIPTMQKYEDDLRDQWQSRAHRAEWTRMLKQVLNWHKVAPVTLLSGEIHLATRARMGPQGSGVQQLVASGIAHRAPPKSYARGLGVLARLGDAPIRDQKISIESLPGQAERYAAERNYLELVRDGEAWSAIWHLEDSGVTPALAL